MTAQETTEIGMAIFALILIGIFILGIAILLYELVFVHPEYIYEFDLKKALEADYSS